MANLFTWITAGILIFIAVLGLIGFFYLFRRRLKREGRGDVFLMNKDSKGGSPPIEIRAQRDYRYKDADVDPYDKSQYVIPKQRTDEREIIQTRKKTLNEEKETESKIQQIRKADELRAIDFQSKDGKKRKIKELLSYKEKTSLQWISTVTMIPIESVIEILTEDSNFIIKDDSVLFAKMLAKSESTMPDERRVSAQELREREEKIAEGICPICSNSFEPNSEYCPNCGYVLN
ncbi:MAG: hypothetical protein KAX09_01840 [Candidatus Heimdallarchaeota archaeon]|nr:hypothetical protein [Candidatus Heimdallarchaeota archaeon]MCK4289701.1 hypothetical protein [Candidatus Heimdallarchaeota archaeon]